MHHPSYIVPAVLTFIPFVVCLFTALFPVRALDVYTTRIKWNLVLMPPRKNRSYCWFTAIFGFIGTVFFGFALFSCIYAVFYPRNF